MDDFSFPTIQTDQDSLPRLPFPHYAASPVWFTSSPTADNPVRRSCSFKEEAKRDPEPDTNNLAVCSSGRLIVDEEKMDMLWEDFNEELIRVSREMGSEKDSKANSDESVATTVDRCEWSASKSGSIIHHRRPSLLLILKVLKKLFLIQKASSARNTSHC
ncbi:uncharacterized protein LOC109723067 [Ananas comosus]|uniref:Uncharacterized protein LOC109723067 n=1 Tax=Ananas comosus TaxID=4615 RepID=A0A6P5GE20_ANACO|nr:uncharacterized protein LOC109723067 [Ananas comosus]